MTDVQFLQGLITLVSDFTRIAAFVPLITLLVNIGKIVWPNIQAKYISLILQVVFWIAYTLATRLGGVEPVRLDTWIEAITTAALAIVPLFFSLGGTTLAYKASVKLGIPLWDYQRSDPKIERGTVPLAEAA